MRMQTYATTALVDCLFETVDIGEITKMGAKLGFRATSEPSDDPSETGWQVRLQRLETVSDLEEASAMAMLCAYVNNLSGQQILDRIREEMEERHFPLDRPIQDVMEIGGGPDHEGHEH